jgi:hypothetical protein
MNLLIHRQGQAGRQQGADYEISAAELATIDLSLLIAFHSCCPSVKIPYVIYWPKWIRSASNQQTFTGLSGSGGATAGWRGACVMSGEELTACEKRAHALSVSENERLRGLLAQREQEYQRLQQENQRLQQQLAQRSQPPAATRAAAGSKSKRKRAAGADGSKRSTKRAAGADGSKPGSCAKSAASSTKRAAAGSKPRSTKHKEDWMSPITGETHAPVKADPMTRRRRNLMRLHPDVNGAAQDDTLKVLPPKTPKPAWYESQLWGAQDTDT